jgi:glycosyltransferase involved in cell wall biosynthesis
LYSIKENKKVLIEKATRIIAVSNNTKKDILQIYPHIDASKIDVVYHGVSIVNNATTVVGLPSKYILYVGSRPTYKNFHFLVQAVKSLLDADPTLFLVCAGGGKFTTDEKEFTANMGLSKKIIQKNFEEEALGFFYKNAKCFVFPSIYEGFGIPVLEAMASGCPIVLAKHSSFPEVAGEAGIYFDLTDSEDLKNKIELVLNDENLAQEYRKKGFEQVKKFDWDNAAKQCYEVYKKALL